MSEAINAMSDAFKSLSSNTAIVPSRINMPIMDQNALHLSMPAYIKGGKYIMIKLVNVHYDNPKNNLPLINGIILLMDSKNGIPLAFMDGKSITALRTGASSGLATKILSNQNSKSAVVIGSGIQALSQIEAIRNVRELDSIKVIGRDINKVQEFCTKFDSLVKPGINDSLKGGIAHLTIQSYDITSPLHLLLANDNLKEKEILKLLKIVEDRIKFKDLIDFRGYNLIFIAIFENYFEIVKYLDKQKVALDYLAPVTTHQPFRASYPLAIKNKNKNIIN